MSDPKADLHRYLRAARETLLWKLDGLSEQDPPSNGADRYQLAGVGQAPCRWRGGVLRRHLRRPFGERLPWLEDEPEPNVDMWATAEESREQIVGLYQRAWAHSDATIDALALDAIGQVPWWPGERSAATLHQILVHMIAETNRHAGHADIVRELIDGAVGVRPGNDNMAPGDQAWWASYRDRLEREARSAI